jgi:cation diffusion facilitator family transporter
MATPDTPPSSAASDGVDIIRWGWYSIAINVLLAALHGLIAWRSGSLAVAAELIHNLVDLLAAVAVLIGLKLANRTSAAFPYGLYKLENLIAAMLAALVFVTAYEIARDALLAPPTPVQADAWMLVLLLVTALIPQLFSYYELRAGRTANSPALIADAREYRMHVYTTGLALAALAAHWLDLALDRIAALIIVLAVVKTGWELLRDAMRVLLDASLDPATLQQIREVIEAEGTVAEIKWLTGRNAGRYRFVEAGVALRVRELDRVTAVVRRIEAAIRSRVPHVERALLHVEAAAAPTLLCAVPLADADGAVSAHFGEAPYFALVRIRRADGIVEQQQIIANPHVGAERAKGMRVAEWLVRQKVDTVLSNADLQGKGADYALRDAGVEQRPLQGATLAAALAALTPPD